MTRRAYLLKRLMNFNLELLNFLKQLDDDGFESILIKLENLLLQKRQENYEQAGENIFKNCNSSTLGGKGRKQRKMEKERK